MASTLPSARMPPLLTAYGRRYRPRGDCEPRFTIEPDLCFIMIGNTARQHQRVGYNDRSSSSFTSSSVYRWYGLIQIVPPTLLTNTSIRPYALRAWVIKSCAPANVL